MVAPPHDQMAAKSRVEQDKSTSEVIECFEGIQNKLFTQPQTLIGALHQRLDKYTADLESAKGEGNESKARRMGRNVKRYEDTIKKLKAGKSVDFSELPTPPGFSPISVGGAAQPARTAPSEVPPVRLGRI